MDNKREEFIKSGKYKEILEFVRQEYPQCFGKQAIPLKIGIHKDLREKHEDKFANSEIRKFLRIYCYSKKYKAVLKEGAGRVDLSGAVTSVVTKEKLSEEIKNEVEV